MSRHDMLDWVNDTVHGQYKKIEELCSGVAYCQMMDLLFPNTINLKRVKYNAKLELEFLHNLKLLQAAFTKLKFDKSVPIDRLLKGKFQDNFEFLQWFKKFFDTHSTGKENLKVPEALAAAAQNQPKPIKKPAIEILTVPAKAKNSKTSKNNGKQQEEKTVSPASLRVQQETIQQLSERMLIVEQERNSFYQKLKKIEETLNDSLSKEVHVLWCTRALSVLYGDSQEISNS